MSLWDFVVQASGPAALVVAAVAGFSQITNTLRSQAFRRFCWWLLIAFFLYSSVASIIAFAYSVEPISRMQVVGLVFHFLVAVMYLSFALLELVQHLLKRKKRSSEAIEER